MEELLSKICTKCKRDKCITLYNKHKNGIFGRQSACKVCEKRIKDRRKEESKIVAKAWRSTNTEKAKLATRFWEYKKRGISITKEEYYSLLEKQDNKCAICKRENKHRALCLDHCHKTGKVRGFLCDPCNIALGKLEDNKESLQNALNYLENNG